VRVFDSEPLGEHDYVLSADEKPGVQARSRIHPSAPARPGGRPMRVESEYRRHGTVAYLAAYDVHRARVIGHCAPTTGIAPFTELVEKVMTREPYASARRVFWVVDNGSSHRGWTAAARLSDAFPNAQMIHLPVHASWLNMVVRHEVARDAVVHVKGGSTDVEDVGPGLVRKDRPRLGVRRG
jgi:hypothetical protein